MIWEPVFSPDGKHVAAKAEIRGERLLVLDGKIVSRGYEDLWPPVFSPDGSKLMLRTVEVGAYSKRIAPVGEMIG